MARMRSSYNIPKSDDAFELLCLKILRRKWNCPGLVQYGKRGERQHGIDLFDPTAQSPIRAAQCKLHEPHKTLPPAEIEAEVEKAKSAPYKLELYVIATSAKPSGEAQRKVFEINQKHREQGLFRVEVLHWRELEDLLDEYADVREELYGGLDAEQAARISAQIGNVDENVKQLVAFGSGRFRSVLEEAKQAIEDYDFPVAKRLLERLQRHHWDELSAIERFQLLSRLAATKLGESALRDAAELFLKAKPYHPDDEKAVTNETFAYYLLGDLARAHTLATALRTKYPQSTHLAAIWINSAPASSNAEELLRSVDQHLTRDAEVAVALAFRFMQVGELDRAEEILKAADRGKTQWSSLPFITARVIFASELKAATHIGNARDDDRRARLTEAGDLFSRAVEWATKERQSAVVAEALIDRAQVRRLSGNDVDADRDIEQAAAVAPDEPIAIAQMAELCRKRGDAQRAIEMLRRANQLQPRPDLQYMLALALRARGKGDDYEVAASLLKDVARATPDSPMMTGQREHVLSLAIDCLGRLTRWDDATTMLDELPKGFISAIATESMRASLALDRGDHENANRHADRAVALVSSDSDRDAISYLAGVLNDLGRHKEALPLWQRVVQPGVVGSDPRRLLDTAYRLRRHDVILDVCRRFRAQRDRQPYLLQYELAVLEEYDVDAAIAAIQEHLQSHPDDAVMRLRLSTIGLRVSRGELVDADPSHMPPAADVPASLGLTAVRVMKLSGKVDAALEYGYELLRRHFSDVDAHRAFTLALLPLGPKPHVQEYSTAEPGAAVCYVEDNTSEQRRVVIEDSPPGAPRFHDEIPTNAPLAAQLSGKRVGDKFTLAPSEISPRTATVTQIQNKYVYRYQDCMGQWQIRFPESADVQSVHLKQEADGKVDVSEILRRIDRTHAAAQELEKLYRSMPLPIHMFAAQRGKNAFEGISYFAGNQGSKVFCCTGSKDERQRSFDALNVANALVLDLTALATLMIVDCADVLRSIPVSLIVSQGTMTELQALLLKEELNTAEGGVLGKTDAGYTMVERTDQYRQSRIAAFKQIIDLVQSVAKVVPCRELVGFDPEKRKTLDTAFGRYGAESIILASAPGHVLWTDDQRQASFATTEHGVRRVWTQVVLQFGAERGSLQPDVYVDASAKLLGLDYVFTSSNPQILMRAGQLALWNANYWPLRNALDQFRVEYIDTIGQLQLATLFLLQLYKEPLSPEVRDEVLMRVLDNLAHRPEGLEGVKAIRQSLARIFGLNVVGLEQCAACIDRWLQSRPIFTD